MSRKPRNFQIGETYHITTRCNNREFKLQRWECREVFLYAIKQALDKFKFKLYAVCIMSNHIHYLIEPTQPNDLPKIMHFLNWYTAMCFNRMQKRTGHFWEKRYFCDGFPVSDKERALNTLRYIHGNPKAAKMRSGFFYEFSNYGSYDQLTHDGLTQWHPAFLTLGNNLEDCAGKYRGFCKRYNPKSKPARKCNWGTKLLSGLDLKGTISSRDERRSERNRTNKSANSTQPSSSPASSSPPARCQVTETPVVRAKASQFIRANQALRGESRQK
ncbi:transposase [Nostoc sp.]|uniref:transposase n=1 Tax=Nostoc sp. TaxID=1180 RepID=UPI002FF517F0